jgi:hypothetical protein
MSVGGEYQARPAIAIHVSSIRQLTLSPVSGGRRRTPGSAGRAYGGAFCDAITILCGTTLGLQRPWLSGARKRRTAMRRDDRSSPPKRRNKLAGSAATSSGGMN